MTNLIAHEADTVDETIMNLRERVEALFGTYEGGYKGESMRLLQMAENANMSVWERPNAKAIVSILDELVCRWEIDDIYGDDVNG